MAGSNCIGPSAPAGLAPLDTPGATDRPLSLSTRPMAASTVQSRPAQVAAAARSSASHEAGTAGPRPGSPAAAPTDGVVPPAPATRATQPPRPRATAASAAPATSTTRTIGPLLPSSPVVAERSGGTLALLRDEGGHVRSTMQDGPLLISGILRHGQSVHGESRVVTVEADGYRQATFTEVAARAERLAKALTRLGVRPGDPVGTFCWNNQTHLEAYLAVPSMGAVLHTLNIRLFPEQLAYVIDHAEDKVLIVDATLVPLLARVFDTLKSVEQVIVVGEADTSALGETLSYEALLEAEEPGYDWPELDERDAAAMCYTSGTTGNPKGVVYSHRSTVLHSMAATSAASIGMTEADRLLVIVPMFHANAWGTPYAGFMVGTDLVMPQMFLQGEHLARIIAEQRVTLACGVPTIWNDLLRVAADPAVDLSSLRGVTAGGQPCPGP